MTLVRNYAMVLCNDFMGILLFLYWTMWCSFKETCDIKSFKTSTAYDVWFSRYRPSNLMITADFVMVLAFANFSWAVYRIVYNHGDVSGHRKKITLANLPHNYSMTNQLLWFMTGKQRNIVYQLIMMRIYDFRVMSWIINCYLMWIVRIVY